MKLPVAFFLSLTTGMTGQPLVEAPPTPNLRGHETEYDESEDEYAGRHITADVALKRLMDGNRRFIAQMQTQGRQTSGHRLALAHGQHPHTVVVTCSDSRVPPEMIFDQGLGNLFVIRSAGAVADSVGLASIEFAVESLGARLVMVMGHLGCGAVQAALRTPQNTPTGSENLDVLLKAIRPHVCGFTEKTAGRYLENAVASQVRGSSEDMLKSSNLLRKRHSSGQVKVVKSVYHLDTGFVRYI